MDSEEPPHKAAPPERDPAEPNAGDNLSRGLSLDSVEHQRFERAWAVITEIGLAERHFNSLQADYRRLASTWLLASFAGIGFISSSNLALPLERELLISLVGAAAAVGLGLLWIIDILVYHQLLLACFEEGRKVETDHDQFLPQVRNRMRRVHGESGVAPRVVLFYVVAIAVSLTVSGVAFFAWVLPKSTDLAAASAGAWIAGIVVVILTIVWFSRRVEPR